jgi:hypothetical protein
MSDITPISVTPLSSIPQIISRIEMQSENTIFSDNTKRIVVKGTSRRALETQVIDIQSQTFTTDGRNFNELFNVEFQEF